MVREALRSAVETDGLSDAPWWARFTVRVGVPSAIAVGLVLFLMNLLRGDVAATKQTSADTLTALRAHIEHMQEQDVSSNAARVQQTQILQVICLNMAQMSGGDRNSCLNIR
jgi:hypothetical protein